jgi:hypothetical protein
MKFLFLTFLFLVGFPAFSFAASLVCHSELATSNGLVRSAGDLNQPLGGTMTETSASAILANYRADLVLSHLDTALPTITLVVYKDNQQVGSVPVPIGVTAARNFIYDDFSVTTSCFVRE